MYLGYFNHLSFLYILCLSLRIMSSKWMWPGIKYIVACEAGGADIWDLELIVWSVAIYPFNQREKLDILQKTWEVNIYEVLQKPLPLRVEKVSSLAENHLCNQPCFTELCPASAHVSELYLVSVLCWICRNIVLLSTLTSSYSGNNTPKWKADFA